MRVADAASVGFVWSLKFIVRHRTLFFMREKQSDVSLKACAGRQNIGAGRSAACAATAA
jgi:hypothetical protein